MADINLTQIFEAVNAMATVIKNVASMPGVNMLPYASTVAGAIDLLQTLAEAGKDVAPYVLAIKDTFGDGAKVPTVEELAALDARIASARAELHAPLPAKDEDEPD